MNRSELDGITPQMAGPLIIGTNHNGRRQDEPAATAAGRVNEQIAGLNGERRVPDLDLGATPINADSTPSRENPPDLLHPSEKGHRQCQREIALTLPTLKASTDPRPVFQA